jgi:hypothetical protein
MFSGRIVSGILSLHAETNDDGLWLKGEGVADLYSRAKLR